MKYDHLKTKLEEERTRLESELSGLATRSPHGEGEWDIKNPNLNPMPADKGEMADLEDEREIRAGIGSELEKRLKEVNAALKKFDGGIYGKCEGGGEEISIERLEANPAAGSCIKHEGQ